LSPHQLITIFQKYSQGLEAVEIGLVGYPNVGKSSVINAVLGKKKVGVASMPGKTKHFQTLKLTEDVTLCDCPGLVFPKVS
jgi:large subunit GTPase 1